MDTEELVQLELARLRANMASLRKSHLESADHDSADGGADDGDGGDSDNNDNDDDDNDETGLYEDAPLSQEDRLDRIVDRCKAMIAECVQFSCNPQILHLASTDYVPALTLCL